MSKAAYTAVAGADIALVAATAKTVLNVIAAANANIVITELGIGFDSTVATREAVLVELCQSTQATAGTSTSVTPTQIRGQTRTVQATAAKNYSAEPTALTVIKEWLIEPKSGEFVLQHPLGREPEQINSKGLLLRVTSPDVVNCRCYIEFEEG